MVEKNPGQWEVVGGKPNKSNKSGASKNRKNSSDKTAAASFASNKVKVDELVSPFESQYAILDPELRAKAKREALGIPEKPVETKKVVKTTTSKEVTKKKPSKDSTKENQLKSLPDALKLINTKELDEALAVAKARFSGSPLIWLKDLTTYLNNHLNVEADPTFPGKPVDYPSSLMSSELKKCITSTINSCNHEALQAFYLQTLITLPTDINRGLQVCGTKLVLQQLSLSKPSLALDNLGRIQDILRSIESRVPALLSVLWVTSQAGYKDARIGAKVWMDAMLPLINLKNYSGFVAQVAAHLTPKMKDAKLKADTISVTDYFNLLDQATSSSLPASLRKDVAAFVAALARPMIAVNSAKMFAPLLHRLTSNSEELCKNLVECLKTDSRAFDSWRKEYKSNLRASSHVLRYCIDNESAWAKSSEELRSTLLQFSSINNSLMASDKNPDGMKSCHQLIETFIGSPKPKRKASSTLKNLNWLLLIALVSLVFYDVRVNGHGNFAGSRIGLTFERHGVNAKATELYQRCEPYLAQVREKTQPMVDAASVYVNLLKEKSQPLIDSTTSYAIRMNDIVVKKSKPIVDNALAYAIQLKNIVQQKGEEYFPGMSVEIEKRSAALLVLIQQQSSAALVLVQQLSSTAVEKATVHSSLALELATEYYQKAADVSAAYTQCVRRSLADVMEDPRIQQTLKYTYEMYDRALHYVGLCSH